MLHLPGYAMPNADALNVLTALCPLDGRYRAKVAALADCFSEYALIRERVRVELRWLEALSDEPAIAEVAPFSASTRTPLGDVATRVGVADGECGKAI